MPEDEASQNIALCRRWFEEVWNQGREELIDELFAPGAVSHGLGGSGDEIVGPTAYKAFFEKLRGAFPDLHITVHDVFAAGDRVAARWSAEGTPRAERLGLASAPDKARVTGMSIIRMSGGRITETWVNWDLLGLMQQIGAVSVSRLL